MKHTLLGTSGLRVPAICLGTMTFGEQVAEADAHALMDHALARGVNFLDTAEMYSVPPKAETFGATETILGNWFARRPGVRQQVVLATKVAGPSRNMPWVRGGSPDLTPSDIRAACDASLKRLQTDVIDLYQIHWPVRNAPMFGMAYFDPSRDKPVTSIHDQLDAMAGLVKAGKVRAIGLSNETPYGVAEFVRLAEQHGLPRVATVQNPYCLVNRTVENGLDETMHRLNVSLLAYSPLAFGLLTGKYDASGLTGEAARMAGASGQIRVDAQAALGPARSAGGRASATTSWRGTTASHRCRWRWPSATPNGRWPAPSLASPPRRSWTTTLTRWASPCRPSCWPPSTPSAGT